MSDDHTRGYMMVLAWRRAARIYLNPMARRMLRQARALHDPNDPGVPLDVLLAKGEWKDATLSEQPMPVVNTNPVIQELVMEDVAARLEVGIERYGTGLQADNGRDMLRDAYEEALDLTTYLRGVLYERDGK